MKKLIFLLTVLIYLITSCNNSKHMAKVYPKGYWMKGEYLSNHNYPQSKADSVAWSKR